MAVYFIRGTTPEGEVVTSVDMDRESSIFFYNEWRRTKKYQTVELFCQTASGKRWAVARTRARPKQFTSKSVDPDFPF